ncbi:hypothetical protein PUN28_009185 [Cardiocondyla obscurior]|uniref:Secreted protein n=1 Tax=Cardiocondyla obscurior TaxID=286306 RepID=A0AAW2FWP9_9HYME
MFLWIYILLPIYRSFQLITPRRASRRGLEAEAFSTKYDKSPFATRTKRVDGTPCRCTAPRYGLARDRCRGCLTFLARREIYGQSSVSRPGERARKKKDERKERAPRGRLMRRN